MLTSINSLLANSDIKGPHEEVKLGKSHVASIEAGTYKYYKVAQTDSKSGVYMELSANRPVVDLYASNTNPMPTMEKHMWKSAMRAGAEQGMFMDGHKACTYYVAVTSRVSVDFRLTFHTRRLTRLMDGRIVTGSATLSSAAYYRFKMTDPYAVLVLDVTPLSGDPDLYVSNTALFPSTESYTWRSCGDGGDTIIVNRRDMNFRLGWYYIAVYASGEDSAFSLCARSCKEGREGELSWYHSGLGPARKTDKLLARLEAELAELRDSEMEQERLAQRVDDYEYERRISQLNHKDHVSANRRTVSGKEMGALLDESAKLRNRTTRRRKRFSIVESIGHKELQQWLQQWSWLIALGARTHCLMNALKARGRHADSNASHPAASRHRVFPSALTKPSDSEEPDTEEDLSPSSPANFFELLSMARAAKKLQVLSSTPRARSPTIAEAMRADAFPLPPSRGTTRSPTELPTADIPLQQRSESPAIVRDISSPHRDSQDISRQRQTDSPGEESQASRESLSRRSIDSPNGHGMSESAWSESGGVVRPSRRVSIASPEMTVTFPVEEMNPPVWFPLAPTPPPVMEHLLFTHHDAIIEEEGEEVEAEVEGECVFDVEKEDEEEVQDDAFNDDQSQSPPPAIRVPQNDIEREARRRALRRVPKLNSGPVEWRRYLSRLKKEEAIGTAVEPELGVPGYRDRRPELELDPHIEVHSGAPRRGKRVRRSERYRETRPHEEFVDGWRTDRVGLRGAENPTKWKGCSMRPLSASSPLTSARPPLLSAPYIVDPFPHILRRPYTFKPVAPRLKKPVPPLDLSALEHREPVPPRFKRVPRKERNEFAGPFYDRIQVLLKTATDPLATSEEQMHSDRIAISTNLVSKKNFLYEHRKMVVTEDKKYRPRNRKKRTVYEELEARMAGRM